MNNNTMIENLEKENDLTTNNEPQGKKSLDATSVVNDLKKTGDELTKAFPDLKGDIQNTMKHLVIESLENIVEKTNDDDLVDDADEIIEELTYNLRGAIITPFEFFLSFKNHLFKDKFKNFDFSEEDSDLIYYLIIRNPLFEDEETSYEDRKRVVKRIRNENPGITNEEISIELAYDQSLLGHLYDIINEKIYDNYYRIIKGDRKARFGNLFVGIEERSKNYALHMDLY